MTDKEKIKALRDALTRLRRAFGADVEINPSLDIKTCWETNSQAIRQADDALEATKMTAPTRSSRLHVIPIRKTNMELNSDLVAAGVDTDALRARLDASDLSMVEYLSRYREGLESLANEAGVPLYRNREVFK